MTSKHIQTYNSTPTLSNTMFQMRVLRQNDKMSCPEMVVCFNSQTQTDYKQYKYVPLPGQ